MRSDISTNIEPWKVRVLSRTKDITFNSINGKNKSSLELAFEVAERIFPGSKFKLKRTGTSSWGFCHTFIISDYMNEEISILLSPPKNLDED